MSTEKTIKERTIMRAYKNTDNPYVMINKEFLRDPNLSWKAKGIMTYMLSMPDDWIFYMEELVTNAADGMAGLKSGIKELKEAGYLLRFPVHLEGKIDHWEFRLFETLALASKHCDTTLASTSRKSTTRKALRSKSTATNNDLILNNDLNNILRTNPKNESSENEKANISHVHAIFERLWGMYPLKKAKQAAIAALSKHIKGKSIAEAERVATEIWRGLDACLAEHATKTKLKGQGADIWVSELPYLSTWLNQCRWEDNYDSAENILKGSRRKKSFGVDLAAREERLRQEGL